MSILPIRRTHRPAHVRRHRHVVLILRLVVLATVLVLWQFAVGDPESGRFVLIDEFYVTGPTRCCSRYANGRTKACWSQASG